MELEDDNHAQSIYGASEQSHQILVFPIHSSSQNNGSSFPSHYQTTGVAQIQTQISQNQPVQNQTYLHNEEQIIKEMDFREYKKNFLPIFLQGYELYLKKKKLQQVNGNPSLYQKIDNVFKNLEVAGNDRKKSGIKLIRSLMSIKVPYYNFESTVNDYRRTYAPLYFMKKIPKDEGRKDKLIQYIETLKEQFPSQKLKSHLENKQTKIPRARPKSIEIKIAKPENTNNNKNIYRDLMREIRRMINKQDESNYQHNRKGLYDFFYSYKGEFIAEKQEKLKQIIQKALNQASNKNQKNSIQKFKEEVDQQLNNPQ